jgi:hypothetical protein
MSAIVTWSDLFRAARDQILVLNAQISRDAVERDGSDANILIAGAAAAADQVMGQTTTLAASLFLDSAVGPALDRLVFDRYGLLRTPASPAVGSVQFSTATANPMTFAIPSGTILQTASGTQFITTASAIFLGGSTGPVVVAVRSILAGSSQAANVGTITSIVSQIPNSPSNLSVTNTLATAGSNDAQTDESLRDEARGFFTTVQRGTLAALQEAALGVPGVQTASVFEVVNAQGQPARQVELVVADQFATQFANLTTVPPSFPAQSQVLASNVQIALDNVRAAGIFVGVSVASVVLQAFQLALTFIAGANADVTALNARATVVNFVNALPPGAPLVLGGPNGLLAQIALVSGLQFTGNEIASPSGNVAVAPLQVLRTSLGIVAAVAAQSNIPITTGNNPDAYTVS